MAFYSPSHPNEYDPDILCEGISLVSALADWKERARPYGSYQCFNRVVIWLTNWRDLILKSIL